jgi:hypothetical protein
MAASAPIQFTVDQEQLKIVDNIVAQRKKASLKRSISSLVTEPMVLTLPVTPPTTSHDILSPGGLSVSSHGSTSNSDENPRTQDTKKNDVEWNEEFPEKLPKRMKAKCNDSDATSEEGDEGIYSNGALACKFYPFHMDELFIRIDDVKGSIINPEACEMCSA